MNNRRKKDTFNLETIVIKNDKLDENDLLRLFEADVLAIRIPNYYPLELCQKSTERLLQQGIEHYENAPSIGRKGMTFYETENDPRKVERYYSIAKENMNNIRRIFEPTLSPLDKLRLELQEIWQPGANIENIHSRKMFIGICRLLEPNIDFLPHQDFFHLDSPKNKQAKTLKNQIAANIYLDIDETASGGELDVWSFGFKDTEYPKMLNKNSYGMSRSKIPPPAASIKPKRGELILFNARNIHAVRASAKMRISIACFIGYRGKENPLTYWS